jgi:hypothetical protein
VKLRNQCGSRKKCSALQTAPSRPKGCENSCARSRSFYCTFAQGPEKDEKLWELMIMCKTQYKEATAHHAKLAVAASIYCGRKISAGMITSWCDAALEPFICIPHFNGTKSGRRMVVPSLTGKLSLPKSRRAPSASSIHLHACYQYQVRIDGHHSRLTGTITRILSLKDHVELWNQ